MRQKLLVSIAPDGHGEEIASAARKAGAGGGTILLGRGTASSSLLQLLGLGDSAKEIALSVVAAADAPAIEDAIRSTAARHRAHFGVLFSISVDDFIKGGEESAPFSGDPAMSETSDYRLVHVIVNKGYAEDAMAAARKAGAGGGTILHARGTAREDDAKFFGVPIVPEKDTLLILVPTEKASAVFDAIRSLPCLAEKGSGIVFTLPVSDFAVLGRP